MYGVCTSCPGAETVEALLQNELDVMIIQYKQWAVTDIASFMTVTQQSDEFIENLASKMPEMTCHHYTASQQARYLRESKENLLPDQCIVLADFSENYSFIFQDAIKGFSLGTQLTNSLSLHCLYQRATPANFVILCN
jgi:hypothetical protein